MSNQICSYYNVGYCKEKNQCSKIHPMDDCEEKCKEKTCLKRHRRSCRDRDSCIFYKSGSCEFLHENITEERQTQIDLLLKENKELKEEINKKNIQIENFGKDIADILKRVDTLEKKNVEPISSSNDLEPKEDIHIPKEKGPFQFSFQEKNEKNVFNYPYKCDNCDKVFDKKPKLKKHIDNDHTYCLLCEKVYPTQESLEFHFNVVHTTEMAKHTIEREPSYQNHKVKRVDIQFQ